MATKQTVLRKILDDLNALSSTATLDISKIWAMMVNAYKDLNETVGVSGDANLYFGVDAGSTDAYAISATGYTVYVNGDIFVFVANTENTGAATLNIEGLGAKTLKKLFDQDLETGDILAGQIIICAYDADNDYFQMLGGGGSTALTEHISNTTDAHGIDGLITKSTVTAKGDILVASANATVDNLPVGATDGDVLTIDSNEALGMKWSTPSSSSSAPVVVDLTDGATITVDLSLGDAFYVVLGGNRTFTFSNPTEGKSYKVYIKQDSTGGRTWTISNTIIWKNGNPGILSMPANVMDIFKLDYMKSTYYGYLSDNYTASGGIIMAYTHDSQDLTPAMTSNSAPSPITVSASSETYSPSYLAWQAFNHTGGNSTYATNTVPSVSFPSG